MDNRSAFVAPCGREVVGDINKRKLFYKMHQKKCDECKGQKFDFQKSSTKEIPVHKVSIDTIKHNPDGTYEWQ